MRAIKIEVVREEPLQLVIVFLRGKRAFHKLIIDKLRADDLNMLNEWLMGGDIYR
jgi:hypothetical protein